MGPVRRGPRILVDLERPLTMTGFRDAGATGLFVDPELTDDSHWACGRSSAALVHHAVQLIRKRLRGSG